MISKEFTTVGTSHRIIRGALMKTPSWEEILSTFDYNLSNKKTITTFENYGLRLTTNQLNNAQNNLQRAIIESNPGYIMNDTHIYISLSKESHTIGKHRDSCDVWFWQLQGQTKWTLWDPDPITYILNPGDIVYNPRRMFHDPRPMGPRAGMSIGIER